MFRQQFIEDNAFLNERGDTADIACKQEFIARHNAMLFRKPEIKPTGFCYNCEDPIKGLFCNITCTEDWQKREDMSKYNDS